MAADVGQGTTLELTGVGSSDVTGVTIPERSITAHDVTKLSDTERTFIAGRVKANGTIRARAFVGDGNEPTLAWTGTAVVTLPTPEGMTTPRVLTFTGFVSRIGETQADPDGVLSYEFEFTVNTRVQTDEA